MKKTLLTMALALTASAFGTTLDDAILRTSNASNDLSTVVTSADNGSFTVAAQLNASIFADIATGQSAAAYRLIAIQGTFSDGTTTKYIGVGTGYSSTGGVMTKSGLWGMACAANSTANPSDYVNIGKDSVFTASVCENVASAALVFSYDSTTFDSITRLVITYSDGKADTVINATNNVFKWSNATIASIDNFTLNTSAVTNAWVFQGALDSATCASLATEMLPEPATATLSLLALAGLAVRRRRK